MLDGVAKLLIAEFFKALVARAGGDIAAPPAIGFRLRRLLFRILRFLGLAR